VNERDTFGQELGFAQDKDTGTWWGPCPRCGDRASVGLSSWTCPRCGALTLAAAVRELVEETWQEAPDVPGAPDPEPFPVGTLPPVLREHVTSVAASIQVPPDMPALLSLLSVSAAVGGKAVAEIDNSWRSEWLVLYGIAILPSGERKSATYAQLISPIEEWEATRSAEVRPLHRAAEDVVDVRKKALEQATRSAANGKISLEKVEAARIALDKAEARVPPLPRVLVGDATPEALVQRMAESGGRAALLSPEGGPLMIADGRYSDGSPRLDELKKAWSGEPLTPDRIGRDAGHVRHPALTLGLTIQPGVLGNLRNRRSMQGEGVFARFLFVRPRSLAGTRVNSGRAAAADTSAAQRYGETIWRLLDAEPKAYQRDGTPIPHTVRLSDSALVALYEYTDELEAQKSPLAPLAGILDWAEKAHGNAVRVACMLHLAIRASASQDIFGGSVSRDVMEAAIQIMRALTTHALAVFTEIGADQDQEDQIYVLRRLRELPAGSTLRDLHVASRGKRSLPRMEDLNNVIDALVERGCLRVRMRPSTGGRPPSPIAELHPSLRTLHAQKAH